MQKVVGSIPTYSTIFTMKGETQVRFAFHGKYAPAEFRAALARRPAQPAERSRAAADTSGEACVTKPGHCRHVRRSRRNEAGQLQTRPAKPA